MILNNRCKDNEKSAIIHMFAEKNVKTTCSRMRSFPMKV